MAKMCISCGSMTSELAACIDCFDVKEVESDEVAMPYLQAAFMPVDVYVGE